MSKAHIIAVANHKGGVGKTTTTLNLGKALSLLGSRVLIVDIDPQSNLSQSLGIDEPESSIYNMLCQGAEIPVLSLSTGFFIIPSDLELSMAENMLQKDVNGYFQLKNSLQKIASEYDYILIDCPPSLGILTINAFIAATEVLIVIQSEYLAIKGLGTIQELVASIKINLNPDLKIGGVLITQFDKRVVIKRTIAENVLKSFDSLLFKTQIRYNITIAEASVDNKDIFTYNDKSPGAIDYLNLAREVIARHPEKILVQVV